MYHLSRTDVYRRWEQSLKDRMARFLIVERIARLEGGHFGDCRFVGDGVQELRIFSGPGYRIYFTLQQQRIILLLCGGDKGSQQQDIIRARKLKREIDT